ncbi:hypothetical protein Acr_08g0011880 [Actinidia rufa]|uniref:Uncharacterized protein n=1 Tax=Actinidia rufa TaxID=165716 RepID=A0A7J0F276_9ERIC|nr:hypothetical protein Acr_08g0011880 [Actinidia rufa]
MDALAPFRQGSHDGTQPNGKVGGIIAAAKNCISRLRSDFETKLSDDLHPEYISNVALQEVLRFIDSFMNQLKGLDIHQKKQQNQQLSVIQSLSELENEVKQVLSILGISTLSKRAAGSAI